MPYCGGEKGAGPFSDLASPEVAPDKTHLRPQEHQRSACYADTISFCASPYQVWPTARGRQPPPQVSPGAPGFLALTQTESLPSADCPEEASVLRSTGTLC